MAVRDSIASNETELLAALQSNPKAIPQGATWFEKEPNEYDAFGEEQNRVARSPINSGRMRKKPTVVGYDVNTGFSQDLTPENSIAEMESFLFANKRNKGDVVTTGVLADGYSVAAGGAVFKAGNLIIVEGDSENVGNTGVKLLASDGANNKITAPGTAVEAGKVLRVRKCGHQFDAGDASIAIVAGRPKLVIADFDATTLGLIPGEFVYLNGDNPAHVFGNAANVGFARVFKVETTGITFDKTDETFVADNGAGKNIRIFFGTVVKNEKDPALQKAFYWCFRRRLGRPDDGAALVQSEVTIGNIASEMEITIPEEDKVTYSLSYMARTYKAFADDAEVDGGGTIKRVVEADAVNSAKDARRFRIGVYPRFGSGDVLPTNLFPAFNELTLNINNNVSANKAIGHVGAYAHTPGFFDIMLSCNAYFADTTGLDALNRNADLTFDICFAKDNKGVAFDIPLFGGSTEGLAVEANEAIMLELEGDAAEATKYNAAFTHVLLCVFFPYLPDVSSD